MVYYIYTAPHDAFSKKKHNPNNYIKNKEKNKEVYIRITILNFNA